MRFNTRIKISDRLELIHTLLQESGLFGLDIFIVTVWLARLCRLYSMF
jgi:hypothetical protein